MRPATAACQKFVFRIVWATLIVSLGAAGSATAARAQQTLENPLQAPPAQTATQKPFIERIEFYGNLTYPRDMLLARIFSRAGDPYNPDSLRRDFHALWNTGYFENIQLIVQTDPQNPNAKIVIFYVTERPVIRRIRYVGNKSVSESDILDAFQKAKVNLSVEDRFDPTNIERAVVVIKELLAVHGRQFATVKPTYEKIPDVNAVILTFNVNEGPKVKVGKIQFTGNHAFSNGRLVRSMKNTRPYAIPLYLFNIPVMSKTFDQDKLEQDLETGVRALYQDNGYFRVVVSDNPAEKTVDVHRPGIPWIPIPWIGAVNGKATNITIPIEEGSKYRMGNLFIRSSDPQQGLDFSLAALKTVFPLKTGSIFDADQVRKSFTNYTKLYGAYGFIDFTPTPQFDINEKSKVINLTLVFDQGKQFYVRRIDFSGNTTTRDKVIRRELLLSEGDLFNSHLWDLSILRLNQLGYFQKIQNSDATITRNSNQGTVDILLHVKEKGKQSIGLTGGVSGLTGTFIGFNYQTNNFLGLGETLTFEADAGTLNRQFTFGFTEPYLFDRPISTGFTVFSDRYSYNQSLETSLLIGQRVNVPGNIAQNYNISTSGFTVFVSTPWRRSPFARIGVNYGYSRSSLTTFSSASQVLFDALQFRSFAGPSQLTGILSSKITPTFSYSTVNSPLNPTSGKSIYMSLGFEGGPLQGNVHSVSPTLEMKYFHPINNGHNVLAFHLLTAFTTGFGGQVLPPYDRLYTGGEDSVRGFDFYTISPWAFVPTLQTTPISYYDPTVLSASGQPTLRSINVPVLHFAATRPGGDSELIGNFEYRIPLIGNHLTMDFFYDLGLVGILRHNQLALNSTALTTLNEEFPNPDFPTMKIPSLISIAPQTNFHLHTSTGIEFVVQLPIIQAPFRVYYAYNLNRLTNTIVEPSGAYYLSGNEKASLPSQVLQSQIVPQLDSLLATEAGHYAPFLFEPVHSIRFTVSRTF